MKVLCTIINRSQDEYNKAISVLEKYDIHDMNKIVETANRIEYQFKCDCNLLNDITSKINFISFEADKLNCYISYIVHQLKNTDGNILYEERNTGYYEENTYSEYSGKLIRSTIHYPNGTIETSNYCDN